MKVKRHTPKQNDTLPSRKEWEASGFAVPDDLCSDTPKAKVALAPVGSIAEAQAEMLGVKCPHKVVHPEPQKHCCKCGKIVKSAICEEGICPDCFDPSPAKVAQHTPTPWNVLSPKGTLCAWRIVSNDDCNVAFVAQRLSNAEADANAAFIVTACNAHDELVAALRNLEAELHLAYDDVPAGVDACMAQARAVLRKSGAL